MFRRITLLLIAYQCLAMHPVAARVPATDDLEVKLSKRVASYNLSSCNFIEALVHVSRDYEVPMGIVWTYAPAERAGRSPSWHDATVREIIEDIVTTQPGYQVEVGNGIVHVSQFVPIPERQNFLKLKIEEFQVQNALFEVATVRLHMLLSPERYRGNFQWSIAGPGDSRVTIELKDSTVEEILDALVTGSNRKVWVVTFPGDTSLTRRGFRQTVSLWNVKPPPGEVEPTWDFLRWDNPMPDSIPADK